MRYTAMILVAGTLLWPLSVRADSCETGQVEGAYVDGEHMTGVCNNVQTDMDATVPQEAESPGDHDAGWDQANTYLPSSDDSPPQQGS